MSNQCRAGKFKSRGRGGGKSSNQSSQSHNRSTNGNNRNNSNQPKLLFHSQTKDGGYATYATVHDEIISHVQQTYGDDSENALQSLELNAMKTFREPTQRSIPVPQPATDGGNVTDVQKLECDAELQMETVKYQVKTEMWLKEKKTYSIAV